jgi:hypothetical protein
MNEKQAKDIMEALAWMSLPLDKLGQEIFRFPLGEEKDWLRERWKEIFSSFDDVMREVTAQHRELDPLGGGEEWFFKLKQKYETKEFPAKKLSEEEKASAEKAGIEAASQIEKDLDKNDQE